MSYGLEVYNAAGVKVLGVDERCPRVHGNYTTPSVPAGGGTTRFLSIPGMTTDGTWFVEAFSTQHNGTWSIGAGGVTIRNANPNTALPSFPIVVFRG
jgi:hypothetical protein